MDHMSILDYFHWYRRMAYYYMGYKFHELRVASPSTNISKKKEAVKQNDFEAVQKNVLNGRWGIDDVVCINNMSTMIHEAVVLDRWDIFLFLVR
jgi:hypothetical protein